MARVRLFGAEFTATPIRQINATTWLMRAEAHTSRCSPGSEIMVKVAEIVEMAAAEIAERYTTLDGRPIDPSTLVADVPEGFRVIRGPAAGLADLEAESPRLPAGTPIAEHFEVVADSPLEPIGTHAGMAELEAGMAEERKTLPNLLAEFQEQAAQARKEQDDG